MTQRRECHLVRTVEKICIRYSIVTQALSTLFWSLCTDYYCTTGHTRRTLSLLLLLLLHAHDALLVAAGPLVRLDLALEVADALHLLPKVLVLVAEEAVVAQATHQHGNLVVSRVVLK